MDPVPLPFIVDQHPPSTMGDDLGPQILHIPLMQELIIVLVSTSDMPWIDGFLTMRTSPNGRAALRHPSAVYLRLS
jgi:hypothetical protein